MKNSKTYRYLLASVLALFALLTLFLSSSVLFDWFGIRAKEGNYVPIVVWANFICSFLYLLAVYGFLKRNKWSYKVLIISVVVLLVASVGLLFHIDSGGLYEYKTIHALLFRFVVTLLFLTLFYWNLKINVD